MCIYIYIYIHPCLLSRSGFKQNIPPSLVRDRASYCNSQTGNQEYPTEGLLPRVSSFYPQGELVPHRHDFISHFWPPFKPTQNGYSSNGSQKLCQCGFSLRNMSWRFMHLHSLSEAGGAMFEPQDYRWQRTCASNVVQVWLSFTHTISQVDLHALAKAFQAQTRTPGRNQRVNTSATCPHRPWLWSQGYMGKGGGS